DTSSLLPVLSYITHLHLYQSPAPFCPLPQVQKDFREKTACQAHRSLTPACCCLVSPLVIVLFPRHAVQTSVTAYATTSTLIQPRHHPARSTYACKTVVLNEIHHFTARTDFSLFSRYLLCNANRDSVQHGLLTGLLAFTSPGLAAVFLQSK
ncbi:hypothetical protein GOODEAATRI_012606, partial [Goodea atripinnis]